jgi:hypothetical protein
MPGVQVGNLSLKLLLKLLGQGCADLFKGCTDTNIKHYFKRD